MNVRSTRPSRSPCGRRAWPWLLLTLTLIFEGCAAPPPRETPAEPPPQRMSALLARDRDFAVVIAQPGDTFASLAERYLGDAGKAWWIAEFNGVDHPEAGRDVVIPLRARNPLGVYAQGFQAIPILCYHRFGPNR